jgi:hypothetical protein
MSSATSAPNNTLVLTAQSVGAWVPSRCSTAAQRGVRRHKRSRNLWSEKRSKMFAIKAEVSDSRAKAFAFSKQKTMYGGRSIAKGDLIFVFASENEGGPGLVASGIITSAEAIPKKLGITRKRRASASPSGAPRSRSVA